MKKLDAIKKFLEKIEALAEVGNEIDPMEINDGIRTIIDYNKDIITSEYLDDLMLNLN